jgi:rhodanese-related sulfurtransferase
MYGFNEVDATTLAQWLAAGERVRLVDVRTPGETARGVIEGAELIPLHLLPLQAASTDGAAKTVFYCQSGARSAQACMFMAQRGDAEVYNLQGGIVAWARSGQPVVEGSLDLRRA